MNQGFYVAVFLLDFQFSEHSTELSKFALEAFLKKAFIISVSCFLPSYEA